MLYYNNMECKFSISFTNTLVYRTVLSVVLVMATIGTALDVLTEHKRSGKTSSLAICLEHSQHLIIVPRLMVYSLWFWFKLCHLTFSIRDPSNYINWSF